MFIEKFKSKLTDYNLIASFNHGPKNKYFDYPGGDIKRIDQKIFELFEEGPNPLENLIFYHFSSLNW